MRIALVLYHGFTALDLIGPCEVLTRWPDAEVRFVASSRDLVTTDTGMPISPAATFDELPDPDMLLVPGASSPLPPLSDEPLVSWVRSAAGSARWVTSVCTGSGVLAAAGLLQGRRATTHWAFREGLRSMGVDVVPERVVFEDPVVTAAGVSAGIDMALDLTARLHGEATAKQIQLIIEYDPRPPFDVGSVEKADEATIEAATQRLVAAM
jgi:cyclohexyl-isocyanide hydratase